MEKTPQVIIPDSENAKFTCPNDGEISQNDVIFLCNNCSQQELKIVNDVYLCPSCLRPGKNFQCMICESKEVKMTFKKLSHQKR